MFVEFTTLNLFVHPRLSDVISCNEQCSTRITSYRVCNKYGKRICKSFRKKTLMQKLHVYFNPLQFIRFFALIRQIVDKARFWKKTTSIFYLFHFFHGFIYISVISEQTCCAFWQNSRSIGDQQTFHLYKYFDNIIGITNKVQITTHFWNSKSFTCIEWYSFIQCGKKTN